jgi:hypothetical protein
MKSCCLNSRICYKPFGLYIFPQGLLWQPLFYVIGDIMWNVFSIESEFFRFELEIWFIEMSFSVWGDGKWA